MARILALVAALGLVAGAVVLRGAIADDDDNGGGGGGSDSLGVIWCDPLLADACEAAADGADVELIEPGDALAQLGDAEAEPSTTPPSMWVTAGDWPGILAVTSDSDDVATFGEATAVASTPLAVAGNKANLDQLATGCDADLAWSCLAAAASENGFTFGHVTPPSSTGLLTLAALANTVSGDTEPFTLDDLRSQPFPALLKDIDSGTGTFNGATTSAIGKFVAAPALASVFVGPKATLEASTGARKVEVRPVEPVMNVTAHVAPLEVSPNGETPAPSDDTVSDFADSLGEELTGAGWDSPDAGGTEPGLLAALLDQWNSR